MKKTICFYVIAACIFTCLHAMAQQQTIHLDVDSKLITAAHTDNCVAFLTGKEYYFNGRLDWEVWNYTAGMKLRYRAKLDKPSMDNTGDLILSPSGRNVYYVPDDNRNEYRSVADMPIVHIDSTGATNSFTIPPAMMEDDVLNAVFADESYLYAVTKTRPRNVKDNERFIPFLYFVRAGHDGKVEKIKIGLPAPDKDATEWSYLDRTAKVAYFVSRESPDARHVKYRIAVVNHDGKVIDDFKIETSLKQGDMLPSNNLSSAEGSIIIYDHSYNKVVIQYSHGNQGAIYYPNLEAYGNIMFDPISKGFYVVWVIRYAHKKLY